MLACLIRALLVDSAASSMASWTLALCTDQPRLASHRRQRSRPKSLRHLQMLALVATHLWRSALTRQLEAWQDDHWRSDHQRRQPLLV